ncbi:MAG: hypothetical protein ACREO2_10020, partial [Arenimonas sp.]
MAEFPSVSRWRQIIAFALAPLCAALPALFVSGWAILGLVATQLLLGLAWHLFRKETNTVPKQKIKTDWPVYLGLWGMAYG